MKVLQKKYDTLDRQLKELNISLRARFLPKTHKIQLKETLDSKVAYRDDLLWQTQVGYNRFKLKIVFFITFLKKKRFIRKCMLKSQFLKIIYYSSWKCLYCLQVACRWDDHPWATGSLWIVNTPIPIHR